MIGRLDNAAYKGHRELIETWPGVIDAVPGAELMIIGAGPSLAAHRIWPRQARLRNLSRSSDSSPILALTARWRRTVVFAMPSRGEGFGVLTSRRCVGASR